MDATEKKSLAMIAVAAATEQHLRKSNRCQACQGRQLRTKLVPTAQGFKFQVSKFSRLLSPARAGAGRRSEI